ncbi:hypothetical protein BYT27DRAFT_6672718 [Phlegmacium glaucopus]|nr:hypothetical protein BYT27DRAFT_6672718 [Phlegmacium glaucopus]
MNGHLDIVQEFFTHIEWLMNLPTPSRYRRGCLNTQCAIKIFDSNLQSLPRSRYPQLQALTSPSRRRLSSTFKSQKNGAVNVAIRSLEVNYSKNNMKCSLKFEIAQQGWSQQL